MAVFRNFLAGHPGFAPYGGGAAAPTFAGLSPTIHWLYERYRKSPEAGACTMPSGYVYLAQFAAHDLVETAGGAEFWRTGYAAGLNGDRRTGRLALEALYGTAAAAQLDAAGGFAMGRLDLPSVACPARDIRREPVDQAVFPKQAILADRRNDDHIVISQLTALFMLAHNAIMSELARNAPGMPAPADCARAALTMIYQAILRHDLLPMLLAPHVRCHYEVPAPPFVDADPPVGDADPLGGMPVEFSHAAFRFGHASPRREYRLNADASQTLGGLLGLTAHRWKGGAPKLPPDGKWTVNWRFFFDPAEPGLNRSVPIGPHLHVALRNPAQFTDDPSFPDTALPVRDLAGCCMARAWSVPALLAALQGTAAGPLLGTWHRGGWVAGLREWLGKPDPLPAPLPAEAVSVLNDPPLPFFILFEACTECAGRTLGTLGSILVAEVMFRALARADAALDQRLRTLAADRGYAGALDRLAAAFAGPPTMMKLIDFLKPTLPNADPPFA